MKHYTRQLLLLLSVILILSTGVFLLTACGSDTTKEHSNSESITTDSFADKRIGVLTGSISGEYISDKYPNAKVSYFSSNSDSVTAMRSGKLDCVGMDYAEGCYLTSIEDGLSLVAETDIKYETPYGFAFPKTNEGAKLRDEFNEFLSKNNADGGLSDTCNKWLSQSDIDYSTCDYESLDGSNGTLVLATDPSLIPFSYSENGKHLGADIAIATLFCKEYGYKLEILAMDFGAIIASLGTRADFAGASMSITEERAKSVNFSDPYYTSNQSLIYLTNEEQNAGFIESLKVSFTRTFVEKNRWQDFLSGILVTLIITVLSLIFGTLLGFLAYLLCYSGKAFVSRIFDLFSKLINGLPIVVVLMIFYYLVFNKSALNGTAVAVIVFTIIFATEMYSMIKGGVQATGPEQVEAATAMGFTKMHGFFMIILPQAAAHFIPRYKEAVVTQIKATAIVGYIAVQDITKVSDIIRSTTYEAFFPLIATAIVYLILAELLILVVRRIARHVDTKSRKAEKILKGVKTYD